MISYIRHKDIDMDKWDKCLLNSRNSMIYAHSVYLNGMSENWDALVSGDYEAIMPLTWKRKYGIRYLYQPAFMQQGGIYSASPVSSELISIFLNSAKEVFRFAEITLNYGNAFPELTSAFKITNRQNYVLDISKTYEEIYSLYDASYTKSLRRIKKFGLQYIAGTDHDKAIKMYEELYTERLPFFRHKDFISFKKVCDEFSGSGNVITRFVTDADHNIVAALVVLKFNGKLYNVISCITTPGKKLEANYFLYDNLIKEFCNRNLQLDFEGSDVKGIADFYRKFNPVSQPYFFLKFNDLPSVLKIFKK